MGLLKALLPSFHRKQPSRAMERIVNRCFQAANEVNARPECRWPLERQLPPGTTALPAEPFDPRELIGGYVRLKYTLVTQGGGSVQAGAVLPVIGCGPDGRTIRLQLKDGRPGVILDEVPRHCVEVIPNLFWKGSHDGE